MGVFEMKPFSRGTFEVLEQVATSGARTVVGGGDTDVVVHQAGVAQKISFISTGGWGVSGISGRKSTPWGGGFDKETFSPWLRRKPTQADGPSSPATGR